MRDFTKSVPFDPGYSKLAFSFVDQIAFLTNGYSQTKAPHQRKFQLCRLESAILDLIKKSAAFYLGCMLWGGFLKERFKDSPREISGNNTKGLSEKELEELDCAAEVKLIFQYVENFDRDCKYVLKKQIFLFLIKASYINFQQLNQAAENK